MSRAPSLLALLLAVLPGLGMGTQQPNIIYIHTDDWGIGKGPCYEMDEVSQSLIRTPNINRLRREGMQFTRA